MTANTNLRRQPLDRGGYTPEGYYFGFGAPLYHFTHDDGSSIETGYVRGNDRDDAKAAVRASFPAATFYR